MSGGALLLALLAAAAAIAASPANAAVSYDHKAVVINGQRRILISGSIHYPRSTPEMWPDLIQKAKDGGLDVIQTYVFWNGHEPVQGQYYFGDRYDLVRFVKLAKQAGLYVHLRIGPYVCAEWNFGGFPVWLKYVPGMSFRTDNGPFKAAMQKFVEKIVSMMKSEGLFEWQGGPIILAQVENEYGPMESVMGGGAKPYANWAAKMAVATGAGVPWVMCKQDDAPDPVINTCNGFYCDYFTPNSNSKPTMWTEAWTGWFTAFGGAVPHRPVEDLAFAVVRFIQKGGSFVNYYMYFYVKADDDVHINIGITRSILARHRSKPRVYIGCMKSGPVVTKNDSKYYEPNHWKFGTDGNNYFRHATRQLYAVTRDLATYISANQHILHKYSNEDVSFGSWLIGLDVEHVDERSLCCGTPPDCEWKAQAGNPCAASFDWNCTGICSPVERMTEVHQRCWEGRGAEGHAQF